MSDSIFSGQAAGTHPRAPRRAPVQQRASTAHSSAPANAAAQTPSIAAPERPSAPVLSASPGTLRTPTTVASSNDAAIVGILDAPLYPGETAREGFLRKEAELRTIFAALPVTTQRAMHARLSNARPGDQLAERFNRLTAERRTRLLTFLADARRREALAQANHR